MWPRGYRALFAPHLEVLDPAGDVVAREGDLAQGACPMPAGQMLIEVASPAPGRTTVRPAVSITCGQIKADDCHDAIFLAGSSDGELLDAATSIVVDDVCPPTAVCDRRYPFMAMVVLIDGPSVTGTYQVVGQNGADDRADVWNAPLPAHIAAAVAAITSA